MPTVTSTDGTGIEYELSGAGPVVVFIGSGPTDRTSNAELAGLLAGSCTVINYDRRGRGGSGDTAPYAVEKEIEDLQAVVDAAGAPVSLFGDSGGAFLAFRAVAGGMRVDRIAVWEAPYIVPGSRPPVPDDYAEQQAALATAGDSGAMAELFLGTAVGMPAEFVAGLKAGPYWSFLADAASPALVYDAQLAGDFGIDSAQQAKVSCPVLILDGNTTPWLSETADALAKMTPGAVRQTLDGQQHNVEAAVLAPALSAFFAG
ncbi:alpha/beta fold hydrolase [Kribbella sp. NPDC058693]|uniref:alpha/beta fold hydrolase n=1 Tax=Kribbella sp. NPDC058693 TaxID=3346602 RepID=UPI003659D064